MIAKAIPHLIERECCGAGDHVTSPNHEGSWGASSACARLRPGHLLCAAAPGRECRRGTRSAEVPAGLGGVGVKCLPCLPDSCLTELGVEAQYISDVVHGRAAAEGSLSMDAEGIAQGLVVDIDTHCGEGFFADGEGIWAGGGAHPGLEIAVVEEVRIQLGQDGAHWVRQR